MGRCNERKGRRLNYWEGILPVGRMRMRMTSDSG